MGEADKASCTASGGVVERRGRLGVETCIHTYADAGKVCTDSAQCSGKCLATGHEEASTAPVQGQCQHDDHQFGCYAQVNNGHRAATICVD